MFTLPAFATDKLVILSPHRKSIQEEFVPVFQEYYKKTFKTDVQVDWLDQGGTSDDIRFIKSKFQSNPKTADIDIFWGGGTATFTELKDAGILVSYNPKAVQSGDVPKEVSGVAMYDNDKTWVATAMSSFGIFYNKKILQMDKLPAPASWKDLANPVYFKNISQTDPRKSGSANTMNTIILESQGWDKGWEILTAMAANTKNFTHSSSDPIKAIVSSDAAIAPAIDFYALAQIGELGKDNLGFVLPAGETVLDPDPVAMLKGAPNATVAGRFIDFLLTPEAQKLLILPQGSAGGPKRSTMGRMSINKVAYTQTEGKRTNEANPFAMEKGFFSYDVEEVSKYRQVFNDLVGAMMVDTHEDLVKAWEEVRKNGVTPEELKALAKLPVSEKEFQGLAAKWEDNVFRNKKINEWVAFAKKKYQTSAAH
jgi:ABC-type Fe3+ transport system substrate-binding protein